MDSAVHVIDKATGEIVCYLIKGGSVPELPTSDYIILEDRPLLDNPLEYYYDVSDLDNPILKRKIHVELSSPKLIIRADGEDSTYVNVKVVDSNQQIDSITVLIDDYEDDVELVNNEGRTVEVTAIESGPIKVDVKDKVHFFTEGLMLYAQ